ncbi:MAG: SMP-30/gluconolactonase/LRE family protein [Deltaproteobacteria bacterium]|jgi:gluconolactonase|nr:SMP-30/gluconolactonase/LRE family protein [Deltaproteobacteria bacterium]
MSWKAQIVAEGLEFPEGPVYVGENDLYVTEIRGGRVSRLKEGSLEDRWATGGGPNGATLGSDGSLFIANNGGFRASEDGSGSERIDDGVTGRIQRLGPGGDLSDVATDLPGSVPHSPNDLCFGPDGLLYFTDPRWQDFGPHNPGAVHRTDLAGHVELLAEIAMFPNGIAFGPDGRLYVAETVTKKILVYDWQPEGLGEPALFCELPKGLPDGFCFDAEGNLIVCGSMEDAICVFDRSGALADRFDAPEGSHPTNCCIGGGRLWVTYSGPGQIVCFDYATAAHSLLTDSGS